MLEGLHRGVLPPGTQVAIFVIFPACKNTADSSSHTGHLSSCPPTWPWSYLGHRRHVSTHGPPPHQSHQNSETYRRIMQWLRKQPLLPTAMKLSLRFGYRRKAGNPALSVFPWLLLGGCTGVKRGLEDASREDNLILGGRVICIDCRRCHAPPVGTQTRPTWQHKPSPVFAPTTSTFVAKLLS